MKNKNIEEKLNDPEVIRSISEFLLLKKGKINYDFSYMKKDPPGIFPTFVDLPNKKIRINGDFSFSSELTSELLGKVDYGTSNLLQTFYNYFSKLPSRENLILNSLEIEWAKSPFVPDFKNLQKYEKEDFLENDLKSFQKVFSYHGGKSEILGKGEWQIYLAQTYASSLQFVDFARAEDEGRFLI